VTIRLAWPGICTLQHMSLHGTPSPIDLDQVGSKYPVAPYWLEEIAQLIRSGATDAEILSNVQNPDGRFSAIKLPAPRCRLLFAELRELLAPEQAPNGAPTEC